MSESVLVAIIGLLGTLLGGGIVTAYVTLRKSKTEIKVLDTQGTGNIAKVWSDASLLVSSLLNEAQEQNAELRKQSKEAREANRLLELRLVEMENWKEEADRLREVRNGELANNHEKVEALEAGIAALRAQIDKDTKERKELSEKLSEFEKKYNALKEQYDRFKLKYDEAINLLLEALKKAGIEAPPELAHLLGDSISKFKLPKVGK